MPKRAGSRIGGCGIFGAATTHRYSRAWREHARYPRMGVRLMREGEFISDHDVKVANHVANILCGGKVTPGTLVSEQYFLDLERQSFLSLCGEKKTAERIAHTLKTGKPLRN